MRISDWSSDVCSSDLSRRCAARWPRCRSPTCSSLIGCRGRKRKRDRVRADCDARRGGARTAVRAGSRQIGKASCRERVCQYVEISVVVVSLKKKLLQAHIEYEYKCTNNNSYTY